MANYNNPNSRRNNPPTGEYRPLNESPTESQNFNNPNDRTDIPSGMGFQEHTMIAKPNSTEPLGYLFIREPKQRFGYFFIVRKGNATIGRQANHAIQLPDQHISDPHGRIKLEKDEESREQVFVFYDFGSENGTFINGERVQGRHVLSENDEINIGSYIFVFKALM